MGKTNDCIRFQFICLNGLFAKIGFTLEILLVTGPYKDEMEAAGLPNLVWFRAFAGGVIFISSLGIHAGRSENTLALKIFAGSTGVEIIFIFIFGIVLAVEKTKVIGSFEVIFRIAMYFCFGFAATALLGLLMSLLMIHQIKHHDSTEGESTAMWAC